MHTCMLHEERFVSSRSNPYLVIIPADLNFTRAQESQTSTLKCRDTLIRYLACTRYQKENSPASIENLIVLPILLILTLPPPSLFPPKVFVPFIQANDLVTRQGWNRKQKADKHMPWHMQVDASKVPNEKYCSAATPSPNKCPPSIGGPKKQNMHIRKSSTAPTRKCMQEGEGQRQQIRAAHTGATSTSRGEGLRLTTYSCMYGWQINFASPPLHFTKVKKQERCYFDRQNEMTL